MYAQLIEDLICVAILFFPMMGLFLALSWAAEEEERLGITGMSSERILVRAELNENK